jgi:WD40 repeat protein
LQFSADGRRVASVSSSQARVWDRETGATVARLSGSFGSTQAFSPDSLRVADYSRNTVVVRDLKTGKEVLRHLTHTERGSIRALAFSRDGKLLASVIPMKTVRVWDLDRGRELFALPAPASYRPCLAFSPDGRRLAAGGHAVHTIRVWDMETGQETVAVEAPWVFPFSLAFSPDGRRLAAARSTGGVEVFGEPP